MAGQNAEAYWSPDGKRLIFQTTRPPYDCDQIFIMNADGTDQHLVSTGKGRTTCGYFLGDNKHIVYASTHLAGDACPTPPDRSKGYVWGVFAGYDIFEATDAGKIEKRLTDAPGYDAEATVNWKTGNIVYTSLASGDLDLWTMKADGSGEEADHEIAGVRWRRGFLARRERARLARRISERCRADGEVQGIAGGQPDGADEDGTDGGQRRRQQSEDPITNFGCASFAPTFTPDGKKILFASNKQECDSRKFELYLINVDGTGLEQVTNLGGFTSFPEFSPDGKTLVFCSDKDAKERYEFNIFTAKWEK